VTEFPELQQALVHAAGHRRAPRLARPLVVAVACAAIAAAVLLIAREPGNDERAAAPPADPLTKYAVFQRAATKADDLPSAVSGMPGLDIDQARLAERSGPWRIYLVSGTLDGRPSLCAFAVIGQRARFGCDPAGSVHGYGFPPGDGEPGGIVVVVPDGIAQIEVAFDGESFGTSVGRNAALIRVDPWPGGAGTITWDGGEAPLKSP
jgi:hypothetical protein